MRPRGRRHHGHGGSQRRGHLTLRSDRRALKLHASVERRRRDVAGQLDQRGRSGLMDQAFRREDARRRRSDGRILIDGPVDGFFESDANHRLGRLGRQRRRNARRDQGSREECCSFAEGAASLRVRRLR